MRPLFGSISKELEAKLSEIGKEQRFGAGEHIFADGDAAEHLPVIISGKVKMVHFPEPGKELIVGIFESGEMFALPPVFDGKTYPATAIAMEPARLLLIRRPDLLELIKTSPEFAVAVIEWMCEMLREKTSTIQNLAKSSPSSRIAHVLIRLTEHEQHAFPVKVKVRRQEIAEMAGLTTETAIRVIRRFADDGLVRIEHGKVVLDSTDGLSRLIR